MSNEFEAPVELDIAATNTHRCIIVLAHAAAVMPLLSMPVLRTLTILLLVVISLFFHFRQLVRRPWRGLLLQSGGNLMLLDQSANAVPAELLACPLSTAKVIMLVLRVNGQEQSLPVFRCCQPQAYRQLRRFLLRYPPAVETTVGSVQDNSVPNGHRRRSGSVF